MILQFIPLQDAAAQGGGFSGIIMIVLLLLVFWLFMIRPQQKRQKEIKKFREGLSKGDKIVTAGGIFGRITEINEKTFMVEIAPSVKITIDKGSVYPSASEAAQDAQQSNNAK